MKCGSLSTILGTHVTGWLVCQGNLLKPGGSCRPAHILPSSPHPCLRNLSSSFLACPISSVPLQTFPVLPGYLGSSNSKRSWQIPAHCFFFPRFLNSGCSHLFQTTKQLLSCSLIALSISLCIPSLWLWRGEAIRPCVPQVLAHGSTHGSHFFSNESFWCIPACFYGFS